MGSEPQIIFQNWYCYRKTTILKMRTWYKGERILVFNFQTFKLKTQANKIVMNIESWCFQLKIWLFFELSTKDIVM